MFFSYPRFAAFLALALFSCAFSGATTPTLNAALQSGPMLGPVDMREATVWVQTKAPAAVRIVYNEEDVSANRHWTVPVHTTTASGLTAHLTLSAVEPGRTYLYDVEVDGTLLGKPRRLTTPAFYHDRSPPPDLRIAVGGAHYAVEEGFEPPYQILGGGYEIFTTISETEPDMMLWLGNTAHLRPSDWASKGGYLKRFTTARSVPQLQPLLAAVPHYATWSEADYGVAGAGRAYSFRPHAEASFKAFWPQPVEISALGGIVTRFRRADVDFFMLDVRSFRNDLPSSTELPQILGAEQIEWLRQELRRSTATFKIIAAGAPILNPASSPSNLSFVNREKTRFLEMLREERIPGLIFLSGGKYYGELTRLVHANSYNLFDLTVGPLTANPRVNEDELNFFRMPGTSTFDRHFALLDVTGPEEDRQITFRVISIDGTELWNRTLNASQLQRAN